MGSRKVLFFITVLAFGTVMALIEAQRASTRHVPLTDPASIGAPIAPPPSVRAGSTSAHSPASTATPPPPASPLIATAPQTKPPQETPAAASDLVPAPSTPSAPIDTTNTEDDLRSSQDRLNAIEDLAQNTDRLFSTEAVAEGSWSVNPQNMDQLDYQTPDGNITAWFSQDENGNAVIRAQEAQLANGELVDRWFGENGNVEQIMHQYDRGNSYSVYYYATGEIEATRVVRDGNEIFTRYDRDGRQIQRTYTPAE
jgi:hypothetical protein